MSFFIVYSSLNTSTVRAVSAAFTSKKEKFALQRFKFIRKKNSSECFSIILISVLNIAVIYANVCSAERYQVSRGSSEDSAAAAENAFSELAISQ